MPHEADAATEIHFYRANDKDHGYLSNLYRCKVVFEGVEYPTAEHAYQAGKPAKAEVRAWLLAAPTPALCAMAAHGLYKWDVVPDWAKIKFDRMRRVLRAKFEQNVDLAVRLASTGEARLVETGTTNNAVNRLWGEVDGKGENTLGKMLMELRAELQGPGVVMCKLCEHLVDGTTWECPKYQRDTSSACVPVRRLAANTTSEAT